MKNIPKNKKTFTTIIVLLKFYPNLFFLYFNIITDLFGDVLLLLHYL
jgi:hypothetical protein